MSQLDAATLFCISQGHDQGPWVLLQEDSIKGMQACVVQRLLMLMWCYAKSFRGVERWGNSAVKS